MLRERLKKLARVRRRLAYRLMHVLPRVDGHAENNKALHSWPEQPNKKLFYITSTQNCSKLMFGRLKDWRSIRQMPHRLPFSYPFCGNRCSLA